MFKSLSRTETFWPLWYCGISVTIQFIQLLTLPSIAQLWTVFSYLLDEKWRNITFQMYAKINNWELLKSFSQHATCTWFSATSYRQISVYLRVNKRGRFVLTVSTAIDLDPQANASLHAPVQRNEANVSSHNGMLQIMADHTLRVRVSCECLGKENGDLITRSYIHRYRWIISPWCHCIHHHCNSAVLWQ